MRARLTRTLLVAVVATVGALATGCGGDGGASTTTTQAAQPTTQQPPSTMTGPVASTPDATPPPPPTATDAIPTSTVPSPPTNTTPTPQEQQGGGGEQAIRVPAAFVIRGGALTPPQITVPPRLAIELSVRSDGQPHTVVLRTPRPKTLRVQANAKDSVRMPGLRAGSYAITLDGSSAGELVVGGEAGP
jgi:hypothetical protein